MTQVLSSSASLSPIQSHLAALERRRRMVAFAAGAVRAIWLAALAAMVMVLLDAALDLSVPLRIAAAVLVGLILLTAVVLAVPRRSDPQRQIMRDARLLERQHRLWDNPLVNALHLARLAKENDCDLTHELARRSLQRGNAALGAVDGSVIVNKDALRRELDWLWAVCVIWLVLLLIQPALISIGLHRLMIPAGGAMPFSLTQIDMTVEPDPVYIGDDVTVTARLSGRMADQVHFVELDASGHEFQRWPMTDLRGTAESTARARAVGDFERRLHNLHEPITFRIEAGKARSQTLTITPQPRPMEPEIPQPGDEGSDAFDASESEAPSDPGGTLLSPSADEDHGPTLAELFPELFGDVRDLASQLGPIRQAASDLFNSMPDDLDSPDGRQWLADLAELEQAVANLADRAMEVAEMARQLAREHAEHSDALNHLADVLETLAFMRLGECPNPGEGIAEGAGVGGGGGRAIGPSTGFWVQGTEQAARDDLASLGDLLQELQNPYTIFDPTDEPAPDLPDITSRGQSHLRIDHRGQVDAPDAVMQQVPAEYRDLVRQYYNRVRQDAD